MDRVKIAREAIEMFLEYRDRHDYPEDQALEKAVNEFAEAEAFAEPARPTDDEYAEIAVDYLGSAVRDNTRAERIEIGKQIEAGTWAGESED